MLSAEGAAPPNQQGVVWPPWPSSGVGEYILRNNSSVSIEGSAGQQSAAAVVNLAVSGYFASLTRRAKTLGYSVPMPQVSLWSLGSVGISILRMNLPQVDPVVQEALYLVALPSELQVLKFYIAIPPTTQMSISDVRTGILEYARSRVSTWLAQHNGMGIPAPVPGQLLVPREEVLPARAPLPPPGMQRVAWREPLVKHYFVLHTRPGTVDLGTVPQTIAWPYPPTGPFVNEEQLHMVTMATVGGAALLAEELTSLWSVMDPTGPHYFRDISAGHRAGMAVVGAFNCWLLCETERTAVTLGAQQPNTEASNEQVVASRRLDDFRRIAVDSLALSPDDARERPHPVDVFFAWIQNRFGTNETRLGFARMCVNWLKPVWPSICAESPVEGRVERMGLLVARFAFAFNRIYNLAYPVDGVAPPVSRPPHEPRSRRNSATTRAGTDRVA